jgi:hypothetical protein
MREGKAKGIGSTLRLIEGWFFPNPPNGTLLIQQICVSIKEIVRCGKAFPWPRPERCPRCGHVRLWGHGFVSAYFEGYFEPLWLRRYRCPNCRGILRLKPSDYLPRFQSSIETIRQSLAHRFYHHLWPPGSSRQRQGHWLRSLLKKARYYLGLSGMKGGMEAFDELLVLGVNPVSRSF